jgi:hypothetical protein
MIAGQRLWLFKGLAMRVNGMPRVSRSCARRGEADARYRTNDDCEEECCGAGEENCCSVTSWQIPEKVGDSSHDRCALSGDVYTGVA